MDDVFPLLSKVLDVNWIFYDRYTGKLIEHFNDNLFKFNGSNPCFMLLYTIDSIDVSGHFDVIVPQVFATLDDFCMFDLGKDCTVYEE